MAGVWEDVGHTPCAPLSNDASLFSQTMLSLRGIPRCKSPHSSPLCCIHTTNSVSFPGSIFSTPCFSTQPSPALEGSCPRQGCPPLIPKEVLIWAVLRPLELMLANRGDPHLTRKWTCSGGSPSQCPWRPKKPAVGERGYNVGFSSCTPLNNDIAFRYLRLFLQMFPVVELLTPVSSGCLFTIKSCLLPGSLFQTHFPHPALFCKENS